MNKPVLGLLLCICLTGCNNGDGGSMNGRVNSRFNDEAPSLSGNGRWLAFLSNRQGSREIFLYDLQTRSYDGMDGFYRGDDIPDSPSLSRTGRYLAYLVTIDARPQIALYDRLTRQSRLLTNNYQNRIGNPRISPDGRYIAFESAGKGQWGIEVLDRGPDIELDIADGTPVESPNP